MPCRDYDYYDQVNQGSTVEYRDSPETVAKIHKMSKLLCSVMTKLKNNYRLTHDKIVKSDQELEKWWIKHQEDDEREARRETERKRIAQVRKAEEVQRKKLKEQALKKLTPAERKSLNL